MTAMIKTNTHTITMTLVKSVKVEDMCTSEKRGRQKFSIRLVGNIRVAFLKRLDAR